jgi:hypothetical protein
MKDDAASAPADDGNDDGIEWIPLGSGKDTPPDNSALGRLERKMFVGTLKEVRGAAEIMAAASVDPGDPWGAAQWAFKHFVGRGFKVDEIDRMELADLATLIEIGPTRSDQQPPRHHDVGDLCDALDLLASHSASFAHHDAMIREKLTESEPTDRDWDLGLVDSDEPFDEPTSWPAYIRGRRTDIKNWRIYRDYVREAVGSLDKSLVDDQALPVFDRWSARLLMLVQELGEEIAGTEITNRGPADGGWKTPNTLTEAWASRAKELRRFHREVAAIRGIQKADALAGNVPAVKPVVAVNANAPTVHIAGDSARGQVKKGRKGKGGRPQEWNDLVDLSEKMLEEDEHTSDKDICARYCQIYSRRRRPTVEQLVQARKNRKAKTDVLKPM